MTKNVIDDIILVADVAQKWLAVVLNSELPAGLKLEDVPDEAAEVLETGELRIYITLADGTVFAEINIPKDEWFWMHS